MGLDTTHEAWHGAYSAFNRWRDRLAKAAGYSFVTWQDGREWLELDWGGIKQVIDFDLLGQWPAMPVRHDGTPDPLIVLLAHSDCEGEIQAEFCGPLADRLEELIPLLGEEAGGGHIGLYADKTRAFAAGLRRAAEAGESVGFH